MANQAEMNHLPDLDVKSLAWAVKDLLGEPVILTPDMQPEVKYFLGLVAEAWNMRDRLRKPARTIFCKIRDGEVARRRYQDDPMRWLPDWFQKELEALREPKQIHSHKREVRIGSKLDDNKVARSELPEVSENIYNGDDDIFIEDEDEPLTPSLSHDPSLHLPVGPGREISALQSWEKVMAQMRYEVHRELFNQCLQTARPVAFDAVQGWLVIQVENDYARQLFESRLRRTIERALYALADRPIRIELTLAPPFALALEPACEPEA
jgi:hypothetical protein